MEADTIAAISSAVSRSGIGIIRISGPEAFEVIDRMYQSKKEGKRLSEEKSHTIHYGFIQEAGEIIDEVLVMLMRAPHTYTAEDTVEINCHGGIWAMNRILQTALRQGARLAEPGEFTKRAFLHGRIDLSQAEAVMDVIQAENEFALKNSISQLRGGLKEKVQDLRNRILYELAFLEAALDDPEHYPLDDYGEKLSPKLKTLQQELKKMILSAEDGKIIKEGIRTVIAGSPNAGKSSLMNALLGEEKAIVTEIAGTTRDVLEDTMQLQGITLHLVDTAGIHQTADRIEQIGVERARRQIEEAELVLFVADASRPLGEEDREILEALKGHKAILLLNKSDLPCRLTGEKLQEIMGKDYPILSISALYQKGMEELGKEIHRLFYQGEISFQNQTYITNLRQKHLLEEAQNSLQQVQKGITLQMPEDLLAIDLRSACEALGKITGDQVEEDLVNEIFGKFCMGK